MTQTALTADIIAKEALMIAENELAILGTFYRAYEDEYDKRVNGYMVGETISIRRPHDPTPRTGATMSVQEVVEGKVALTVDQQIGHDFAFTSADLSLRINDLSERVIRPAMINIVNAIAKDCLEQFYRGVYHWAGTAGQTINSFPDFVLGPKRLDKMAVMGADRKAALSPDDFYGMLGATSSSFFNPAIVSEAYRNGKLGDVSGCETLKVQVLPTHTTGTRDDTTPLVKGASQNVTYATAKDTWTQTLDTDGWDNSCTLKAGDVFTIAGVYMVNPRTKATLNELQQFVVTADTTAHASGGTTTLTISPPIITSGPHQTVSAVPADDAAITNVGSASTGYQQNLVYHKNAFALAVVPMIMPQGAVNGSRRSYKGLSCRVIPVYDGTSDVSKWRLDMLYGRKLIDPRIATRLSGTA